MLKGSHSVCVVVLAALVIAVAFAGATGGPVRLGHAAPGPTPAHKPAQKRTVQQPQRLSAAGPVQLAGAQSQLEQAQQQQAARQESAGGPASLSPAPPPGAPSVGSVQSIIMDAFAPLGATAQQWGLCIAQHESGDNPSAIQDGGGGAEGLFQFEPGTWPMTPQGAAGDSIFDATASAEAAAWEYHRGNYSAWTTNAVYCSQYD